MSDYKTTLKNIDHIDRDIRIAFVVGEFNLHHTAPLEKINREFLEENGFGNIDSYWVPGAFEIPGFTAKILEGDQYDLVITLWVVIRWDTPHFDYVCGESARGIMDLTTSYETPIIFGVLTCNTEEQVLSRIGPHFALAGLNLLVEIGKIEA
jgi:6,7-dimethyl-8-ribityllumazine synthase